MLHPRTHDLDPLGPARAWPCWLWNTGKNTGTMGLIYFNKLKLYCAFGKKFINIMLPWSKNNMYQYIFCPSLGSWFPTPRLHKCFTVLHVHNSFFLLMCLQVKTLLMCHSSYMFAIYVYLNSSKL